MSGILERMAGVRTRATPVPIKHLSELKRLLTGREIEICNMICSGISTKGIANAMGISATTVDTHRVNVRRKLGFTNSQKNLATCLLELKREP